MNGPLYQAYLTTSGQSLESVVGRKAWQAQLERFNREGKDTLQQLGLLK
jgi:hypothetical protein